MDEGLIDRIYECAVAAERWPAVLDDLSAIAGAHGGYLCTARQGLLNWTASETMRGSMERTAAGDWLRRGERLPRLQRARHPGFLVESDLYTESELRHDLMYRDFLWPAGFGHGAAMMVPLPTGDTLIFGVERLRARGPVERAIIQRLDRLRPHLARSGLISARLQLERARVASQTLALLGLAAMVVDAAGRVLAANALIEALEHHVTWRAGDRVVLKDKPANTLLHQAIAGFASSAPVSVRSFALRGADEAAAMVVHALPICGAARDLIVRCAGIVVLTPVALPGAPPVELIQSLFDLSAAEARVARGLAEGATVDEIASAGRVSSNTVRTQVRGVLSKTGCCRQTDVVALLGGLGVSRP